MAKTPKTPKGGNPHAQNGPYATGGFVGKGKKHKGDHRGQGLLGRLFGKKKGK